MKKLKRLLSSLLVAVMVLTAAPLSGFVGLDFTQKASAISSSGKCGDNVTYTFDSKTGLLTISGTGDMWGDCWEATQFHGDSSIKSVVINSGVTNIGHMVFWGCRGLTSVTIPNSVTHIVNGAFEECTGLKSITIPDSVTHIDDFSFYGCTGLTSITIQDSGISIGREAFYNTGYYNNTDNWVDNVLYIGNHLIKANDKISGSYAIKSGTRTIAMYAFSGCTGLTSIKIPDSVISIDGDAFRGCTNLTSVAIGNSVTSIGSFAFDGCIGLTSIIIPDSVTNIEDYAFNYCSGLTNITIPDSVTDIGGEAFYKTGYYNNIDNWVDNVLYIGNHLIEAKDTIIGSYIIKCGTRTIADYAFYYCTGLTSIIIPDSVTSICDCAFTDCSVLSSVTIGKNVKSIGYSAFNDCTNISDVYYSGSEADWGKIKIYPYNVDLTCATIHYNCKNAHEHSYSVAVDDISLNYKKTATLNPVVTADEGANYTVTYTSSDPSVAAVDENGNVYGAKKGSAEITVTVTDECGNSVSDTCTVKVKYSFGQWLLVILLFGWIWY